MITLASNEQTTRTVIAVVQKTGKFAGNSSRIVWKVNGAYGLYYNPAITAGTLVGAMIPNSYLPAPPSQTLADIIAGFEPDYLVLGTNGFASAVNAAGLWAWNGSSTQADTNGVSRLADDIAAQFVLANYSSIFA